MALNKLTTKKITHLRRRGRSIKEISKILNVSKSTVSRHVRAVSILPAYKKRLLERQNTSKERFRRDLEEAKRRAEIKLPNLTQKDLVIVLSSIYWAEGNKKDLTLTNTDPEMIRTFIYILKKVFYVSEEKITISLRIYEDLDKKKCLEFWSRVTGVKLSNKTTVSVLTGRKNGKLNYGMCRVRVKKGGKLLKEIFSIISRINLFTGPL